MAPHCRDAEAVEAHRKVGVSNALRSSLPRSRPLSSSGAASWGGQAGTTADQHAEEVRVVIADDDDCFRRLVVALLKGDDGIEVVGEARSGRLAIAQALELVPDLVLLDLRMPDGDGILAAGQIRRLLPDTKVVMLTGSGERDDVQAAVRAGANGYLLKDDILNDVAGALRFLAGGGGFLLAPSVGPKLLAQPRDRRREYGGLSERELGVLRLMGLGYPNHRIADELCLSPHTVKRHVANILSKLDQRSRGEAVLHAIRAGMLTAHAS